MQEFKKFKVLILFFLLSFNLFNAQNKGYIEGKVIGITDGDTFSLLLEKDNFDIKIRINAIDCPERKQPYSQKAKQHLSNLIFGKNIKVYYSKKDGYGRVLGTVFVNNVNVNEEMIRSGFAWHYVKYSKDTELQKIEEIAKANKIGLWSDPHAIPPWEWRKTKHK